jgi:hypothetical protein
VLRPQQRSATCNYYLCDDAFALAENEGELGVISVKHAHDRIAEFLGGCDMELSVRVAERFPEGPVWDEAFLDWLAGELDEVLRGSSLSSRDVSTHQPA